MSRYFFHIRDGLVFVPDEEGMECRNLMAVWEEALASASDLAVSNFRSSAVGPSATIEIEDEDGNAVEGTVSKQSLH